MEKRLKKPNGYWTYERCYEEALKYKTRSEFGKNAGVAYKTSRKQGWINNYTWFHNEKIDSIQKHTKWNYKTVFELAKNCKSKSELKNKNNRAYTVAKNNGWFTDFTWFCSTEELLHKSRPNRLKYDYQTCFNIAIKYQYKSEFAKENRSVYTICNRNGWLDDFYWLQNSCKNFKTIDTVYAYIWFREKSIYIGRTVDIKSRDNHHRTNAKSSVYRFSVKNELEIPQMTILVENITINQGLKYEDFYVKEYIQKGWNVLNVAKTGVKSGSVGNMLKKWTKKSCYKEALNYTTLKEFRENSTSAYNVSVRNNWAKDYKWLSRTNKPSGFYDYKTCYKEAQKYARRIDFSKNCPTAYEKSLKEKWIDDFVWFQEPKCRKKYDYKYTYELAKNYTKLKDFRKAHGRAYSVARKNNWIKDYTWLEKKDISQKKVCQYDLSGNLINTFNGAREASRLIGCSSSGVIMCCNGKFKQYKGFIWKYKK